MLESLERERSQPYHIFSSRLKNGDIYPLDFIPPPGLRKKVDWRKIERERCERPELLAHPSKLVEKRIKRFNDYTGELIAELQKDPDRGISKKDEPWRFGRRLELKLLKPYDALKKLGVIAFIHGISGAEGFFQIKDGQVQRMESLTNGKAVELLSHFTGEGAI